MKGKIKIGWKEYIAECGKCARNEVLHFLSRREAEKEFRHGGWRVIKGQWVCKSCATQQENKTDPKEEL